MVVKKRRRSPTCAIERANRKSDEEFIADYLEPGAPGSSPWAPEWTHPRTEEKYQISLGRSTHLSRADLDACFSLIEETSRTDYENSTRRWRPDKKRVEMKSEDLRYILLKDAAGMVMGFTSLMPTYEEGQPVVYCYEIHLKPDLRGTGLGALVLGYQSTIAYNLPPITKVMLSCFLSNARALLFYSKMGFERDGIAPRAKKLRGKLVEPDYTILSKCIVRGKGNLKRGATEANPAKRVAM